MTETILPFLKPVQPLLSAWLLLTSPTAEAQSINMLANLEYYTITMAGMVNKFNRWTPIDNPMR